MLIFDVLRVKNATYGGTSADLEWALKAHALLTSQGVRNSAAQSQVCKALKARIDSGDRNESAMGWAQKKVITVPRSQLIGARSSWQDILVSFSWYSCLTFVVLGAVMLLNGVSANLWALLLAFCIGAACLCVQGGWKFVLGRMRLVPAIVLLLLFLVAFVVVIGLVGSSNKFSIPDGVALPAWVMLVVGAVSGLAGLLFLRRIETGTLNTWHQSMTDSQWKHTAQLYARQKLLLNEAYLDQHLAAAQQAATAERRPLVEMCGNPISYLQTAPKDPTYRPWVQLLGFTVSGLLMFLLGTYLLLSHEDRWWLGYLIAAIAAMSAFGAYREYSNAKLK